jgi:hypothetical protein
MPQTLNMHPGDAPTEYGERAPERARRALRNVAECACNSGTASGRSARAIKARTAEQLRLGDVCRQDGSS